MQSLISRWCLLFHLMYLLVSNVNTTNIKSSALKCIWCQSWKQDFLYFRFSFKYKRRKTRAIVWRLIVMFVNFISLDTYQWKYVLRYKKIISLKKFKFTWAEWFIENFQLVMIQNWNKHREFFLDCKRFCQFKFSFWVR